MTIFCNYKVIASLQYSARPGKATKSDTRRSSGFTAGSEGLSQVMLSFCVMSADLVASLQIFDVMQMWYPSEKSKKLFLALAMTKHKQLSSLVDFFQTNTKPNIVTHEYCRTIVRLFGPVFFKRCSILK